MALPDAVVSTLSGIFDVLNCTGIAFGDTTAAIPSPFLVEIVGEAVGPLDLASGVPIHVQRCIDDIEATDIVIAPSLLLPPEGWQTDRYPGLVEWLIEMNRCRLSLIDLNHFTRSVKVVYSHADYIFEIVSCDTSLPNLSNSP